MAGGPSRVALFGGSFNPPHVAHQLVALYVLETAAVDELWFIPAFQHPFDKPLESFDDRFEMCQLAAAALGPRVRVSDIEARLAGPSRTLRTAQKLIEEHPQTRFSLVIGSDLARETATWHGADELARLISFIVVARAGHAAAAAAPAGAVAMPAVSSTEIRAALASGRGVDALLPKSVLDYVLAHGLYGSRQ
ncbi:MAG: nicotinate (nicotinamide) nucleotide adenylyltransferase [Pseudomonadota bacterium]